LVRDNSTTWTIPLRVTVSVGDGAAPPIVASDETPVVPRDQPQAPPAGETPDPKDIGEAAKLAAQEFKKWVPGVLRVRPGWKLSGGWITNTRAIVVIVDEKKSTSTLAEEGRAKLPDQYKGFPVDVRQVSAEELYEMDRIGSGTALLERTPNPTYEPPAGLSLPRVKEEMRVTVHVSPEHGWPILDGFLQGTNKKLTVGMYDFGAPHIVQTINTHFPAANAGLQLVIQYGASVGDGTKEDDTDDADTIAAIEAVLGGSFTHHWADVAQKDSLWASAYHIKVAVRDSQSVWLSSGNWQSSNQAPGAPPQDNQEQKKLLTTYNREWHVVIDNANVAGIFEGYLQWDFDASADFVPKALLEAYELVPSAGPAAFEAQVEIRSFDPLQIDREVDMQPLLTPDNYVEHVLALIESATDRLYFQNQYINESLDPRATTTFIPLVEAIGRKMAEGLDVRIILRGDTPTEARHLEFLKNCGIDLDKVRWRNRTHTKGIIVDGKRVLLGSHNWSYDGTVLNRDASVIFFDEEIAGYLEEVFLYDWEAWSKARPYVPENAPAVHEISNPQELAALKQHAAANGLTVRRLFHPED
jgi:hypothetical protein